MIVNNSGYRQNPSQNLIYAAINIFIGTIVESFSVEQFLIFKLDSIQSRFVYSVDIFTIVNIRLRLFKSTAYMSPEHPNYFKNFNFFGTVEAAL